MRTAFTKILLAFLIAWLPVSVVHASANCLHVLEAPTAAGMDEHASMHHMPPDAPQQTSCTHHDCGLCYSCLAAATGITAPSLPVGKDTLAASDFFSLTSFFPEQPERPPKD